jgi:hypothetical protein
LNQSAKDRDTRSDCLFCGIVFGILQGEFRRIFAHSAAPARRVPARNGKGVAGIESPNIQGTWAFAAEKSRYTSNDERVG